MTNYELLKKWKKIAARRWSQVLQERRRADTFDTENKVLGTKVKDLEGRLENLKYALEETKANRKELEEKLKKHDYYVARVKFLENFAHSLGLTIRIQARIMTENSNEYNKLVDWNKQDPVSEIREILCPGGKTGPVGPEHFSKIAKVVGLEVK